MKKKEIDVFEERQQLLDNKQFCAFLKYLYSNAYKILPPVALWFLDGCELYFGDTHRIKDILNE